MTQYLTSLVAISSLVGVCSYISYGEVEDKLTKSAMALMLVYVTVAPIVSLAASFAEDGFFKYGEELSDIAIEDTEFHESAEDAFSSGIKQLLKEEFSISETDTEVVIFGFDSIKMKADKVKIILKGRAAMADSRGIIQRINEINIGECEVELRVK